MKAICPCCKTEFSSPPSRFNRATKIGAPVYCSKKCSGISRRSSLTKAEKIVLKKIYDKNYRTKNKAILKQKKHVHFKKTYDPVKASLVRKERMPIHVEYCRQPKYKDYKKEYDKKYRAAEFGDFSESHILLVELSKEILQRMHRYEIAKANGTINKKHNRRFKDEITNRL
jgi:hypothetical protein